MLSEKTIRRRADKLGYKVSKGYSRVGSWEPVVGYNVVDLRLNCLVWKCYNEVCDHLFTLDDVFDFLKEADTENVFAW